MKYKEKILEAVSLYDYKKGLNYDEEIELKNKIVLGNLNQYEFSVESENSYYKYYDVIITTQDNKVDSTYCSCPQFKAFGSCKHVAYALITYEEEIFNNQEINNPLAISKRILDLFTEEKKERTIKKKLNLEIELYILNTYYGRTYYEVKYKIGENKLYSLNNKINNFIDSYRNSNYETKFGKELTYSNNKYYFDKEDEKIINYYINNRNINYYDNEMISRFISILGNKKFSIIGHGIVNNIVDGNPFKTYLSKDKDKYTLKFTNMNDVFLLGENPIYAYYENTLYRLSENTFKLIANIAHYNLDSLTFGNEDLNKFTNGVLNVIKDEIKIDNELENEIIICKKPKTKLYFDYYYNAISCNIVFDYNNNEVNYFDKTSNILRDKDYEEEVLNRLFDYNFKIVNDKIIMDDIDYIGEFIENDLAKLLDEYEVYTSDKVKKTKILKSNVRSSFGIGEDNILSYNFNLGNISDKEIDDVLNSLKNKKKYYRLKNGDIINLEEDNDLKELNRLIDDMDIDNLDSGVIPKYRAIYLDSLKNTKYSIIETNNLFDNFIDNFNKYKDLDVNLSKKDLSILRDYQVTGVKWLYNIYKCELGSILADEMGLGKSIQFIYFIKQILKENKDYKILIVAPTSLIFNWEKEFEKFGSELKYKVLYGNKEKRIEQLDNIDENIIITTYGLIREDIDIYKDINFEVMAIDEAQNIKNVSALISKSVKKINAKVKFALTGTPLENSVLELWSIFDFIMPGFLTNLKAFQSKYNIKDTDEENINRLDNLKIQIKPFILRRKKSDVLTELPPKIENNIYIDLNTEQKKLYASVVEKTKKEIEELVNTEGFEKSRIKILSLITRLRQICIDPKIIYENYKHESSKMIELVKIVKEVIGNGHKILIFTSFKTALDIANRELNNEGITSYVIDGSVKAKRRMELVENFNKDDTNVFLITLKAGGTGLNLTSADVVIHLDLWWNPQVENQATDRSHRIGQKNTVEVIKLVCKGTIEEKILELQNKKKILADTLIEGEDRDKNIISSLSEEDIRSLFTYDNEEEQEYLRV